MAKKIVFVVGAGASTEANLPDGKKLISEIPKLLGARKDDDRIIEDRMDVSIKNALKKYSEVKNKISTLSLFMKEIGNLTDALKYAISIDNLIDTHQDNSKLVLCGKLAIIQAILKAEKGSHLYVDQTIINPINPCFNKPLALDKTWYIPFLKLITEGCTKAEIKERFKCITLIIFNYDRCIEHFLYHALQKYYIISGAEAAELITYLNIYHPYGTVGTLPWSHGKHSINFGADIHENKLMELVREIKTFTEETGQNSSDILGIRNHMYTASEVVFLGFAFHKQNMQLITPCDPKGNKRRLCFASTMGISDSAQTIIEAQIKGLYKWAPVVFMKKTSCSDFFAEYWKNIAF